MELIRNQLLDKTLEDCVSGEKFLFKVKSAELSVKARLEGKDLYTRKNHDIATNEKILNLFSKSIALAPDVSEELALGFGNRSALLFHMRRYKECNLDIDRALDITDSKFLKIKLLCRKVESLSALGKKCNEDSLDKAISYFNSLSESNKDKNYLHSVISKSKNVLEKNMKRLSLDNEKYDQLKDFDPSELVNIRYTEKYGRHLTASKSFKPGELIFKEKPFVSIPNPCIPYVHCTHCLSVAWTGVPCYSCSLCIFCSDKCRDEAWLQYHDVECSIISHIKKLHGNMPQNFHLALRTLIIGMKQTNDIIKFEEELKKVDKCIDKRMRGLSDNKKLERHFRSIYSLSYNISGKDEEINVRNAAIALAYVAKYTSFLGTDILKNQAVSILAEINDVLLIGAVLLRLIKICDVNAYHVVNSAQRCQHSTESFRCFLKNCEFEALCFAPFYSLINNCCVSNAKACFTKDQQIAVYAVEPIEKGSQIFISYVCNFYDTPKDTNRLALLKKYFHFTCDCIACKKNWPALINSLEGIEKGYTSKMHHLLELEFASKYKEVVIASQNKTCLCDKTTIEKLMEGVEKAVEQIPHPSRMRCILTLSLQRAFEKVYGYDIKKFLC